MGDIMWSLITLSVAVVAVVVFVWLENKKQVRHQAKTDSLHLAYLLRRKQWLIEMLGMLKA